MKERDILILGVESSCDETAAAVVKNGRETLSNVVNTQIEIHKRYGGVVPEIASRNHVMAVQSVVDEALKNAGATLQDVTAVAVTYGAGLVGALLVGVSYAKALAYAAGKPLVPVSHIKGHIAANYLAHPDLEPPYLCLVVSGGHTAIVEVTSYLEHRLIGTTIDDAVGEAFDKVARVMGLSYPGGVNLDRLARLGKDTVPLPVMLKGEATYQLSYSGLKTAAINALHTAEQRGTPIPVPDMCCSFQHAAVDALLVRAERAMKEFHLKKLALAGGVAANSYLRASGEALAKRVGGNVYFPPPALCTDNAAMIASAGYYNYLEGIFAGLDLNASANVPL